ncbi:MULTISPECIES: GH92 family glycosyl hydrolase [Niastella]|uniref:GH92 family glycosyl hydrolase n=1 Tax=Niastella soli TaxID=2821487 RepID=A0ABS3Z2J0_9BACT|nr:GH92 family glycosyl hydrolase [Niastella soli]MBO9204374.1 GH92 family glycosyl hydrolase [Niastella soli]
MKRTVLFLLLQVYAVVLWAQSTSTAGVTIHDNNTRFVDPRIGNVGALLQPTRPTVQQPNQMVRMHPLRADYLDDQIVSFPLNIVSHRLGEVFAIKPTTKQVRLSSWKEPLLYDHDLEITRPWYYSTWLVNDDITVEFTPGKKTGCYRFTFPANSAKNVLFSPYNNGEGEFNFNSAREITGMEIYHGNIKVYVYGQFNVDAIAGTVKGNTLQTASSVTGKEVKAWASFPASSPPVIEFKYAISYLSAEQAKKNFSNELADVSFEQMQQQAANAWNKVMGQIQVTGGTEAQKRSFYTALYRCYERPVDITEDGQYFSGFDNKVHTAKNNRPFYVDDWTWDTYLAQHPLRTVLNPAMEEDILNSYVNMYEQGGWMPTFPVLFGDHACMNGFHSSVMFLDGYRKGLRNFDVQQAYAGMKKNATQATMLPWRNGPSTSLDDHYRTNGYFPALQKGVTETNSAVHPFEKRQAVAVTLAGSYDDWALGELAKELGKNDDYKAFNAHAVNYKNLWNSSRGLFLPKDDKGHWVEIDPKFDGGMGGRDYYDENNGWTYLWQVQHDISGLISLMNGKDSFEQKLDQLFHEGLDRSKYEFWAKFPDATALVGQYSMGNEPSFHIPYLYNYTNSPWKTQKRIRFLLDVWFKDNIFGIPGDEDGGGMSAFVVFSSMGFYPVTPGLPVYTIGSPLFERVTIDLPGGKQFHVNAKNCSVVNKYIQSARFNGQPLARPWFTHEQLMAGGTLELEMGPKPNREWGVER